MFDGVEAGEVYRVTRHDHEIARIVPRDPDAQLLLRKQNSGSRLSGMPRHDLRTAGSIEDLLADERER